MGQIQKGTKLEPPRNQIQGQPDTRARQMMWDASVEHMKGACRLLKFEINSKRIGNHRNMKGSTAATAGFLRSGTNSFRDSRGLTQRDLRDRSTGGAFLTKHTFHSGVSSSRRGPYLQLPKQSLLSCLQTRYRAF